MQPVRPALPEFDRNGFKRDPPQMEGRIKALERNFFANCSCFSSSHSLLFMTALCGEAQAPSRLPSGRELKYSSLSALLTFSTSPVMRTCLSNSFQKNTRQA